MSKTTDYKVQWTPELREAVDNRIVEYLLQGYSQQEAEDKAVLDLLDHTTFNFSDDVVVTAKDSLKKEVAVESDWDPGYTKFMSGARYYADQGHKNYLDWLRNDYTRGIRLATDKWGKGIGLGMTALAALPVASGAAAGISTGLNAFKTAYPALYSGIKTGLDVGFTVDGVRNTLSDNGVQKTYRIGKDIYQNGFTGLKAWDFAKSATGDVLDIAGGVGLAKLSVPLFSPEARLARAMNKNIKQGIQSGLYYHGSPNRNISRFKIGKDGGIYFTQNKNAAKLYTGAFGTGKVYNADLDLGNKTITIDNGGAAWTKIPENTVAEAFNLTRQQVHDIVGSYNLGEVPWHYGFTKMFGYKPKNNYYAIDQVVKLGKDLGISSLIINNAKDNGKRLFSRTMPYDLTIVYNPKQIILGGQTPNLKLYGIWKNSNNGLIRLGYTTSGIKQTGTPTGNFHWREDITDIDNPILLDVKPDMHYTRTRTTPVIKEITNVDDVLLRIGIVPISNTPVLAVEQITVNPANRLVKVGERIDLNLSPNRVVQFEYQPRLADNKGRLVSSDADKYFGIPTKTETSYTLWHKSGGTIHIKKKNLGSFTRYCNGKVTEECIRKGKNSSNPTTRKRANFAWVARHKFKHEEGGKLNYLNYFK